MVPIGIVTRDRIAYLDVTLRSLSDTRLPAGTSVVIYDDHSAEKTTKDYYHTNKIVQVATDWPTSASWKSQGLSIINDYYALPVGIHGMVDVYSLAAKPLGVVNASCRAICHLFDNHPAATGVILLQDDVLFKHDWYSQMLRVASQWMLYADRPLGVLAGLKLNHRIDIRGEPPLAVPTGITAQCLYVSRLAYQRSFSYFHKEHKIDKKFDDTMRREISNAGLWAGCIYPFVCQHFGIQSLVRPTRSWSQGTKGRVGYYIEPPYAMQPAVRKFKR